MGYFTDTVRALATSLKNVFRPPVTFEYPKVIRPRAERYRASFALVHEENGDEACIGCLQCERICPSKVIAIKGPVKRDSPVTGKKRSYADDFTLDLSACIFCELCVQVCPTDAIVMTREQEQPSWTREELVLTMPKLYANEKSKTRAWADGTKLMGMQAIPKPPAPPKAEAPAAAATKIEPGAAAAKIEPGAATTGTASVEPSAAPRPEPIAAAAEPEAAPATKPTAGAPVP